MSQYQSRASGVQKKIGAAFEFFLYPLNDEIDPVRIRSLPVGHQLLPEDPIAVDTAILLIDQSSRRGHHTLPDDGGDDESTPNDDEADTHTDESVPSSRRPVGISHRCHPQVTSPGEERGRYQDAEDGHQAGKIVNQQKTRIHKPHKTPESRERKTKEEAIPSLQYSSVQAPKAATWSQHTEPSEGSPRRNLTGIIRMNPVNDDVVVSIPGRLAKNTRPGLQAVGHRNAPNLIHHHQGTHTDTQDPA